MRVHINTYGRTTAAEARKVLLIHGAGMDQSVWTLQGRWLAFHGWNAFAVDLPGHGRSRGQPALASIEDHADWLGGLLAEMGGPPAWIIGHSMGALIALETAARHADAVAGLCLLGAAARMPVHPTLFALAERGDPKTVELMVDWAFGPRGHVGGNPMPGGWMMGTARSFLLRGDPDVLHTDLRACDAYASGETSAAKLRCPALVVIGGEDRMTPPPACEKLAGLIPNARTARIEGAGHMMMLERPDETLDRIRTFLA